MGNLGLWKWSGSSNYLELHLNALLLIIAHLFFRTEEALGDTQREKEELKKKLDQVLTETQNQQIRMTAELEDLGQTKNNLEERLIELIRYVMWCFLMWNTKVYLNNELKKVNTYKKIAEQPNVSFLFFKAFSIKHFTCIYI